MTNANPSSDRSRWLRIALAAALVAMLAVGAYLVWPSRTGNKVVAYFTSAVGLYPGDDVRIVGVPVGTIDSIEPRASDVKVTMTIHDDVKVANDAKALIISPNLVSSRFVQLAPAYTGGPALADGASIGLDRTAVPVEWDEVKEQLTALSRELGPQQGSLQGPLSNLREPGRRHLRRKRRLVPPGASRAVADSGQAGRLADRPVRHREESAGARQRAVEQQRADRAVHQPRRVGVAGARRQLGGSRQHARHLESGPRRCSRLPQ